MAGTTDSLSPASSYKLDCLNAQRQTARRATERQLNRNVWCSAESRARVTFALRRIILFEILYKGPDRFLFTFCYAWVSLFWTNWNQGCSKNQINRKKTQLAEGIGGFPPHAFRRSSREPKRASCSSDGTWKRFPRLRAEWLWWLPPQLMSSKLARSIFTCILTCHLM